MNLTSKVLLVIFGVAILSMGLVLSVDATNPEWPQCQHWIAYHSDGLIYGEWWTGSCSHPSTNLIGEYIQDVR